MNSLSVKRWTSLIMCIIGILAWIIDKRANARQPSAKMEYRFYQVRRNIAKDLAQLRLQYARGETDVCQNTLLDIEQSWRSRDLLFAHLNHHAPQFPDDSLASLRILIEHHASFIVISAEISRIEQRNDNN